MTEEFDSTLEGVDDGRRAFLKKVVVGTAFAVPVVSSFTMTGIKAVYAETPSASGQVGSAGASTSPTTAGNQTTATSTTTTTQVNSTQPPG